MRVYCDYDNTLVDTHGAWLKILSDRHGIRLRKQDVLYAKYVEDTYGNWTLDYCKRKNFYDVVPPIPGAIWFLDALREVAGEENVFLLSASHVENAKEKSAHAWKHFRFPKDRFIHSRIKHTVTRDGVLVDDYVKHVAAHVRRNAKRGVLLNLHGEFGWCEEERYADNPEVSLDLSLMNRALYHRCTGYDHALDLLARDVGGLATA